MGRDKKACMLWLKGKNMRKRLARNVCSTSIKEWPEKITLSGSSGLKVSRPMKYSR
jgi:hypothetical protein